MELRGFCRHTGIIGAILFASLTFEECPAARGADPASNSPAFEVGFGERDITPPAGLADVGVTTRHDMLSMQGRSIRSSPRRS